MSRLSEWLSDRVSSLGLSQKEISTRFHELLGDAKPSLSFATVQPKLSKLLKGDPEGERCFFGDLRREKALAETLRTTVEQLRALRATRTLVLDSALDSAAVEYLLAAAGRPNATHSCVPVSVEPTPEGRDFHASQRELQARQRDALRARAKENPGALVVRAGRACDSFGDQSFFDGAAIEVTTVEKHPRGWTLTGTADLVPLPPPREPPVFDRGGEPMMPHEQFAADARRTATARRGGRSAAPYDGERRMAVEAHVRACDERDEVPSFRVAGELAECLSQESNASVLPNPVPWSDLGARTFWWVHGRKVLAVGPNVAGFAAALAPHHDVSVPVALDEWKAGLERWNPWRLTEADSPGCALQARVIEVCGFDPVRLGSVEWARARANACTDLALQPVDETGIADARALISELAARGIEPGPMLELPFVLDQAARAPIRLLRGTGRDQLHVLANLGAGRVLRIRIRMFVDDRRRSLEHAAKVDSEGGASTRYVNGTAVPLVFDGGDVRLWLQYSEEPLLEGFALPARTGRAREADEAAARDQRAAARSMNDD